MREKGSGWETKSEVGMRCPNCQTVNPPNAKFCLECGKRMIVCPNCGTVNLPIAKFCIECGTALQTTQPATTNKRTPSTVQAKNSGTQSPADLPAHQEERRVVTVMFADITGSTPLADRMNPKRCEPSSRATLT